MEKNNIVGYAVNCPTLRKAKKIVNFLVEKNLTDYSQNLLDDWYCYKKELCYSIDLSCFKINIHCIGFCYKKWYEENNYVMLSVNDFIDKINDLLNQRYNVEKTIYVVKLYKNDYPDNVCCFEDEREAKRYCYREQDDMDYLKKFAILNNHVNHEYLFDDINKKFKNDILKKRYGKEHEDDLTDVEFNEYNTFIEDYDNLKEYMIKSCDINYHIAECTIEYIKNYSTDIIDEFSYKVESIILRKHIL